MDDILIFNEAVESQILTSQYQPTSLGALLNDFSRFEEQSLEETDLSDISASYEGVESNLEEDGELLALFIYFKVFQAVTGEPFTGELPEKAKTKINKNIALQNYKGQSIKFNPSKKIQKAKNNHLRQMRSAIKSGDQGRVRSITRLFKNQVSSIINTYIHHAGLNSRQEAYSLIPQKHFWMYLSILDSRTTSYCASMAYTVSEKLSFWPNLPPAHYNCRSMLIPVSSKKAARGIAESASIGNWLSEKSEEFQKDYLGTKRFKQFTEGKLTGPDLVKALTRRFRTAQDLLDKV